MKEPLQGLLPFVAVAEARGFRGGAQRLGLTPAAVSRAVAALEEELGVQLFRRTTRRVELTPEGAVYLERCQQALTALRAGREQLELSRADPDGALSLSMSPLFVPVLAPRLPQWLALHPGLRPRVQVTDRYADLVAEPVDVALRIGEPEGATVRARRLAGSTWVCVASPAWAARHPLASPADLRGEHLLVYHATRGRTPWVFRDGWGGLPERVRFESDDGNLLLALAEEGLGVTRTFDWRARELVARGRLVEVLGDQRVPGPPIHALTLPGRAALPRVKLLLEHLAELWSSEAGRAR